MSEPPDWYAAGRPHVWLPYAQMKTAPPPLAVAGTEGSRIVLADGRELIDGIASWWTACHGYNHRHIRDAVRRQLDVMPHVMFGGLAHKPAYTGLLIFHEIFTGFGRTGTMCACEQAGVVPDIVTLSKALTGGTLPLSAAIARKHVFEAFWSDDPWTTRCTP